MKLKSACALAFLGVCVSSGSAIASGQKLYPVQGPLAAKTPPVVIAGHIRRPLFSLGSLFFLLKSWSFANGETLEGKCVQVKASSLNSVQLGSPSSYPPRPDLSSAWDAVFGQGYFVAHVMGNTIGQGIFKGNQGTILQVESLDGQKGVAVDNRGNVYKLAW
jgi:hypothetical protein